MTTPSNTLHRQFYGAQYDFVTTPHHFAALCGGVGSGKSYAGAGRALLASLGNIGGATIPTPNLGVITAATYPMLRDATFRVFRDVAGDQIAEVHRGEFRCVMRNGSEVLFRSATEPENLRGPNALWWWGDEAALYGPMVMKIMIGRLRQHGQQGYAWVTTTPKGRNWLYQEFIGRGDPDYVIYRARTIDNPFIDAAFVASLAQNYTGDFARQELDGDFVAFEGLIYLEFRYEVHVVTEWPRQFKRVVAGVDWGYANPGVMLVCGIDADDRLWVIHEEYTRQQRVEEWASLAGQLRATYGVDTFYCDPSEPSYIEQVQQAGCYAEGAVNDVLPGIQEVKNRLVTRGDGRPRLYVAADCVNLIAEFNQYQWMENRDGVRDQPKKVNDHALDALRYAAMGVAGGDELLAGYVEAAYTTLQGAY